MNQLQQLLIVLGVLALLPTVVKLLWKIYLFPLSAVITATRLFWPGWAACHLGACIGLCGERLVFRCCMGNPVQAETAARGRMAE